MEVDNSRLVIDEQLREAAKRKLEGQQFAVLLKLNEITAAAWEIDCIDNENILQCFIEWVTLSYNPQVLNSLPEHYALKKLFEYIQDDRRTNETAECLKRLILHLDSPAEVPAFYEYLGKKVVELLSVVDYFAEHAELTEAEDYLASIVEFCRRSAASFAAAFDDRTFNFLSRLARYTEDDLVEAYETLLDFWEDLLEELVRQRGRAGPQAAALVGQVYDAVCRKCRYSVRIIAELNTRSEQKLYECSRSAEEVHARREYSGKMFERVAEFFGKPQYLQMVFGKIQAIAQEAEERLWPSLEVYVFSLTQALKRMEQAGSEISNIIGIYVELTSKENLVVPVIIRKSFLGIFRSLMTVQEKDLGFIKLLFNLASTCFEHPLLMPFAEKAFAKGCEHNHQLMRASAEEMVGLVQKYPNREHIVRGIAHLIAHDEELGCKFLPPLLAFLFAKLQEAAADRQLAKELMYSLTAVVKVLQEVAPDSSSYAALVGSFTRSAFPFILEAIRCPKRLSNDEDPEVERMTKLIKMIMRYIRFGFTEFIEPLYSAVLEAFPKYPICSYAYLLEIAITVFYGNEQYTEYFKGVYVQFCGILFGHMNQIEKMEKYSYLLDDFIGISKRFFLYNASIVLNSGQLPNIIALCTSAFIGSDTPRIARAAYTFFETIFMVYWRQEFIDEHNADQAAEKFVRKTDDQALYYQLKNLLAEKLEFIVTKVLEHLSKGPSESTREQILDALVSEIKAFPQENCVLWPNILARLPPDILVANEKARFKSNLEAMLSSDFNEAREAARFLKKYVYLMNKRMINANNRKLKY